MLPTSMRPGEEQATPIVACAAGSLDELAQMSAALVEASPQQHLVVQIGRGLALPDTLQELCLGDGPQVNWQTLTDRGNKQRWSAQESFTVLRDCPQVTWQTLSDRGNIQCVQCKHGFALKLSDTGWLDWCQHS